MRAPNLVCLSLLLLVGLVIVSCNDDDPAAIPTGAGVLAGFSTVAPSVEGTWTITSSVVTTTCGPLNNLFPAGSNRLDALQAGDHVTFTQQDSCGSPLPAGEGEVDVTRTVSLESTSTQVLTGTCTLNLRQTRVGTAANPPNTMTGTDVLEISDAAIDAGSTSSHNCGPDLPCTVTATFTASRCGRSGCGLTCAP